MTAAIDGRLRDLVRRATGGSASRRFGMEPVYRDILVRDLGRLGVEDTFYPVGAAANHGLLYLLARCVIELRPSSVIELGGGQSTLLWDACRKAGKGPESVVTVEHDDGWRRMLSSRVSHPVRHVPLEAARDEGRSYDGYARAALLEAAPERVDLLVVDGPVGGRPDVAHSRLGCLPLLDRLDPSGAAIIVDDAERPGEVALCGRIERILTDRGVRFRRGGVTASKRQEMFSWGTMEQVAHY